MQDTTLGCPGIYLGWMFVPRSLIAQRVKIPSVLFTRIGEYPLCEFMVVG